ncbi:MAG: peroxiredoxin-like family protein [Bacteroidales bacterium]|nr:peroxiredoxin-like family protein [Bacteroidales bacterium]
MKIKTLLIAAILMISSFVSAQLPEKAEDIAPLLIGETIPEVNLKSVNGKDQNLTDLISGKPSVILFYRGGWCPYCNLHLSDIQTAEDRIIELGYQIIAISPESPGNLIALSEKSKLGYTLLSDADGSFMSLLGIAFKAPDRYSNRLLANSEGLNTGFLPVPSVFVVDQEGKILFEYISPDYKTRISSELLLAVLKNL